MGLEPNNILGLVFLSMLNLNIRILFFFEDYLSQQHEMKGLPFNRKFTLHCILKTLCS